MKIIEKYILKELEMPILMGVSLFTFIFLIDIIVGMMENIIVRGISLLDTLRLLSFYLPPILSQTIPMGVFLGVMVTFSKFTRNSESTAMSSIGMGMGSLMKPVLKLALGATLFIFFLQESIIPRSFEKLQYLSVKIAAENPVVQLEEKVLLDNLGDFSIYMDEIDRSKGEALGVLIFQKDKNSTFPILASAKDAKLGNDALILENASFIKLKDNGSKELQGDFKEKRIPLTAYAEDFKLKLKDIETMGVMQLFKSYREAAEDKKTPYLIELNKRIAIPLSTILLAILGMLLSLGHHRTGKGASFALSILVIFVYIVILNVGLVMAGKGSIPVAIGVWTPDLLLGILTLILFKRKSKVM